MRENNKAGFLNTLFFVIYIVFFVSLVFSFRAISSISVGCLALASLLKNKIERKGFLNRDLANLFFVGCCLLFLVELVSLVYTDNKVDGWKNIWGKSVLIAIPLGLLGCGYITETTRRKILNWYGVVLFAACVFALYKACRNYIATNDPSVFFYHRLVLLYSGHAIQFSILVFVGLLHLLETLKRKEVFFNHFFQQFLIIFFSLFLFLLSSKLVIAFYILYLFYYLATTLRRKKSKPLVVMLLAGFAAFCIFIFATDNVISRRFNEIIKTDFSFLRKEQFSPGNYFNGLQFRLLQWKFVPEILNEKQAWLTGVGLGDAQDDLNQKYISENMYTGTIERGDKGFLGYNTHNEFLEALLQTGIIGLGTFLLICFALIRMVYQKKQAELSFITILLLGYGFSESVLESQYSGFIFLFFPLFFYVNGNNYQS